MTFFIEVKFESYHTASNQGIEIEEIQNIKHMNIEKNNEQHSHSGFFRFLYHLVQINWGSKCTECKISRFLVNKFLILVVVIYFLTVNTKLRSAIS